MSDKIRKLLNNQGENYILPFFWQHGEDEATLRQYMKVIHESNIGAVCVESRPHPDFCGPKWWEDMDIILDEARSRGMKVWILDDSHFPTGFANGALEGQPDELCRQGLCCRTYECSGNETLELSKEELNHPKPWQPSQIEQYIGSQSMREFDDDKLVGLYAVKTADGKNGFTDSALRIDLRDYIENNTLSWTAPEGEWKIYALHLSRNVGSHRSYINMMDKTSCRVLIDAVYEPHYARYKDDFGQTIAGFFSDEPELGNGHLYEQQLTFGSYEDVPWSRELEERLHQSLGEDCFLRLALLWEQEADPDEKAAVRYAYMDAVTRLVEEDFSWQIGNWCREHGVQYIGHVIEDNNQHARLGSSLGHFYRGLAGQDMAGIDDIGGQVMPQQEDYDNMERMFGRRIGEFFHYMLGKLGSSSAAIEPVKNGNSMCEIFGAYGWSCGVRLQKYLVDHFLVRGINHYVPHAFSPKEFPDPDCPPHFYAHGHNPQYRHFGALMAYTNRVCELINDGKHIAEVAVLYHAEGEWTGKTMFSHKIGHILSDAQIEYDYIPQDVFAQRDDFKTEITQGTLKVNTQEYKILIIPAAQYITEALASAIPEMQSAGIQVIFVDEYPQGICDASQPDLLKPAIESSQLLAQEQILEAVQKSGAVDISITPADNRLRYYHYEHQDGSAVYLLVNEGSDSYSGTIRINDNRSCCIYDAWENKLYAADYTDGQLKTTVEPLKSQIVIFSKEPVQNLSPKASADGETIAFSGVWKRSLGKSISYPEFGPDKEVSLPDQLAQDEPEFSGFVRYENTFDITAEGNICLTIEDAYEGVEVIVNGQSQGIQVAPPFVYNLSEAVKAGENQLRIEVATTLEREMAKIPDHYTGQVNEATSPSGITGTVSLSFRQK